MPSPILKAWNAFKGRNENIQAVDNGLTVNDYWLQHAIRNIYLLYGDIVTINDDNVDLLKFGRNELVGTSSATIQHQPAGILHETYVSSDLINSVISTNNSDTVELMVEGLTSSDGLTFASVNQTVTLTGQTAVSLTTPLARVTRVYNNNSTALAGVISVTETDTYTAGVPDTDSKIHMQLGIGEQQSEKASTTMANDEYWIVTGFYGDLLKKASGFANIDLELRLPGKIFRHRISISASSSGRGEHLFKPYFIAPKNSDIRLVAEADSANTDVSGGIQGVVAKVTL